MPDEIVLWKLKDNVTNLELDKAFVEREILVPTMVTIPLYESGNMISEERLAALNISKVGYTQEQLDIVFYAGIYAANPDLATRVRQYKARLDELTLPYTASLDEITAAISTSETIANKAAYGSEMNVIYSAIITNLEFCGSDTPHMDAYNELSKLIQYLPLEA
jgi:hypothetical protein